MSFLKHAKYNVVGHHNLKTCVHLVDDREGVAGTFRAGARRDPALVNKTSGMLRDEAHIPAWWYLQANNGLVRNTLGRWVVVEPSGSTTICQCRRAGCRYPSD